MDKISFRTEIQIDKSNFDINHQHKILLTGSCFVENIGTKLQEKKFNVLTNPFGILFNPASIAQSIDDLIIKQAFTEDELVFFNEEWVSFKHHSDFSNPDKAKCLKHINQVFLESKRFIRNADFLFITLGTSIAYRLHSSKNIVANCHKLPANQFEKIHLSTTESLELLAKSLTALRTVNPNIKIIFSLSPVRYIKDNFTENSLSKANLRVCIDELMKSFSNTYYFPAYEILMDDLRDYRFYNADKIHPSPLAIDYIWECFCQTYFNKETQSLNDALNTISNAYHHIVKKTNNAIVKKFKHTYLLKTNQLLKEYPFLDLKKEKIYFSFN